MCRFNALLLGIRRQAHSPRANTNKIKWHPLLFAPLRTGADAHARSISHATCDFGCLLTQVKFFTRLSHKWKLLHPETASWALTTLPTLVTLLPVSG